MCGAENDAFLEKVEASGAEVISWWQFLPSQQMGIIHPPKSCVLPPEIGWDVKGHGAKGKGRTSGKGTGPTYGKGPGVSHYYPAAPETAEEARNRMAETPMEKSPLMSYRKYKGGKPLYDTGKLKHKRADDEEMSGSSSSD